MIGKLNVLKRLLLLGLLLVASVLVMSCDKSKGGGGESNDEEMELAKEGLEEKAPERLTLVATTTMIQDLARTLVGDDLDVQGIMTPGGDPHLYQPRPSDAKMVSEAHIVLTSGFHLEGWIDRLTENAGGVEKTYIVATGSQKPRKVEGFVNAEDPHFWYDLKRWNQAAEYVAQELKKVPGLTDEVKERIDQRLKDYSSEILKNDAWVKKQIETIPEDRRVLITSHDAFGYFGDAYGMTVRGVQGISTEQEASQRDVANVIDLVKETKVPAVFFETSTNPRLASQVSSETKVTLAGPLYSDSIGPKGGAADTLLKTMRENVRMVVEGLGGHYTPLEQGVE